jgi:hypothetical protein
MQASGVRSVAGGYVFPFPPPDPGRLIEPNQLFPLESLGESRRIGKPIGCECLPTRLLIEYNFN